MTFIWLPMLVLLSSIPLCVVVYIRMQQRRRRLAARYGNPGLVHEAAGRRLGVRPHIPSALFLAAPPPPPCPLRRPRTVASLPALEGPSCLPFSGPGRLAPASVSRT